MTKSSADRAPWSVVLVNALFMMAGAAIAAYALYPVYGTPPYLIVAAVGIGGGALIAVLCERLRWGATAAVLLAIAVYVAGGMTVAIPDATGDGRAATDALIELARGPVVGWKDVVTLPLPLGSYRATLVPAFALLLVGTLLATWATLRARRWWPLGAVIISAMVVVAVLLGPATRAPAPSWAPLGVFASREMLVGLATLGLTLGWFSWRAASQRSRAIARAHGAERARLTRAPRLRVLTGGVAVLLMVALAVALGVLTTGPISAHTPRDVARSAIDPALTVESTVTPLATYRTFFAADAYNAVLFTVALEEGAAERVRVATLPHFDGESFSAAAAPDEPAVNFRRVPARIEANAPMQRLTASVTVGVGGGIWVPLVGELGSVSFGGPRRAQLVDGFYYLPDTATGIQVAGGGVVNGDRYRIDAFAPRSERTLASLGPSPGAPTIEADLIPPALTAWVANQEVGRDGDGLATLMERLRARGYLSHALAAPEGGVRPQWQEDLGDYAFAASPAGHSYDRIQRLFVQLNDREAAVIARGGVSLTDDAALVAGVGDDEQFAAAAALVAAELGFPSRVVLGARLQGDGEPDGTPPCDAGQCRGRNMSAWVEVQGADGVWVAADVTPQHADPLAPDTTEQTDPQYGSPLDPERAEAIVPPSVQRGASTDDEAAEEAVDDVPAWLAPALRITGASLLILLAVLGPLLAVVAWKAARRRRRRSGAPVDAVHGGWDEYLDGAVDAGLEPQPLATRTETAAAYATAHGARLAALTDRATFGGTVVDEADASQFWALVEADRAAWLEGRGWWARLRVRASLRSVWRSPASSAAMPRASGPAPRPQWRSEHTGATASRRSRRGSRSRRGRRTEGGA